MATNNTMKNTGTLVLTAILMPFITLAQQEFTYDQSGLNPKYLIVQVEGMSQSDLYKKAINWIKETYKNPDEVIKMTIENEKVKFTGYQDAVFSHTALGSTSYYGATYTIMLSFKEGKYRFEPLFLTYRIPTAQYGETRIQGSTRTIDFDDSSGFYKKNGKPRDVTKAIPEQTASLLNKLNVSLQAYITKPTTGDW